MKVRPGELRTENQIREHYEIEKRLAAVLRDAPKSARGRLYSSLYDDLFRLVPHHPQLTTKFSPEETRRTIDQQIRFLKRFLTPATTFLEIGPGDCALSVEVATHVARVYAVDVSTEITRRDSFPDNFSLVISDGATIPIPDGTADVAYSNQLMEHLHPDDAVDQVRSIYRALAPGGVYICITPNRLVGPSDISGYFDDEPKGFHLKEYTVAELRRLFLSAGFSTVSQFVGTRGVYLEQPSWLTSVLESFLDTLPHRIRRPIAESPARVLLTPRMVAGK